jgi:hypothetical protein
MPKTETYPVTGWDTAWAAVARGSSPRFVITAWRVARATVSLDVIDEVATPVIDLKEDRCAINVLLD